MLKIIGLLSVFLSVPALGSDKDGTDNLWGEGAPTESPVPAAGIAAVSLTESTYTEAEALDIARELYGTISCSSCGKEIGAQIISLLVKLPKPTVNSFKANALEIKGAVDASHICGPTMIIQLASILYLGGLPEVDTAMASFREISADCSSFLTCTVGHTNLIEVFRAQITSLQTLAAPAPSE